MFQVQLSFVVNLSNVFPVQFPNFSLSFSLLLRWLQLLLVQSYISGSTFVVSLYINSCILTSFPLPVAQHFCLRVLPHLSVCMFSLFLLLIIISGLFAVTSYTIRLWFQCLRLCILSSANVYKLYRVSLNIPSSPKWGIPRLSSQ